MVASGLIDLEDPAATEGQLEAAKAGWLDGGATDAAAGWLKGGLVEAATGPAETAALAGWLTAWPPYNWEIRLCSSSM